MKEETTVFEKMLNKEMKDLIGTRNWNVWKNDIEPEMYNTILRVLYKYGEKKLKQGRKEGLKYDGIYSK